MSKKIILPGVFFAALFVCNLWISAPTSGTVKDVNGKPVEGAIVAIYWSLKKADGILPFYSIEVVSDEKGDFKVPGWVRLSTIFWGRMGSGIEFFVVKRNYVPLYRAHADWDSRDFVNATPSLPDAFVLLSLSRADPELIFHSMEDFVGRFCHIYDSSGREVRFVYSSAKLLHEFNLVSRLIPRALTDSGATQFRRALSECGVGDY